MQYTYAINQCENNDLNTVTHTSKKSGNVYREKWACWDASGPDAYPPAGWPNALALWPLGPVEGAARQTLVDNFIGTWLQDLSSSQPLDR